MNRQPYHTPPCWWSPQLSPRWVRFWRPLRRRRGYRQHALTEIEVRNAEVISAAMQRGDGVLVTPNHPSHADPFVLLEAADQLRAPFYFMTAWQVFARTHRVGRRVLRQHGCFSVNREGNDLRAVRQAVRILEQRVAPLVIFPEGEVYHLNDRVTHFRAGAVTAAAWAARRGGRNVSVIPCGLKFQYVSDPTEALQDAMTRLEVRLGYRGDGGLDLVRRLRRFAEAVVAMKEVQFLGQAGRGSLKSRVESLIEVILGRLEDRYRISVPRREIPERVKRLRYRLINQLESPDTSAGERERLQQDLDDAFLVTQFYSYPVDYLASQPSIERVAETIEKLEEDIAGVHRAAPRGDQRAVVAFGSPVVITPQMARSRSAGEATAELGRRVQSILDTINSEQRSPAPAVAPSLSPPAAFVPAVA